MSWHFIFILVWGANDGRIEVNARACLCRKKLLVDLFFAWFRCCKSRLGTTLSGRKLKGMLLRIHEGQCPSDGMESAARLSLSHARQNKFGLPLCSSSELWYWQHLWQSLEQTTLAHFHLSSLKGLKDPLSWVLQNPRLDLWKHIISSNTLKKNILTWLVFFCNIARFRRESGKKSVEDSLPTGVGTLVHQPQSHHGSDAWLPHLQRGTSHPRYGLRELCCTWHEAISKTSGASDEKLTLDTTKWESTLRIQTHKDHRGHHKENTSWHLEKQRSVQDKNLQSGSLQPATTCWQS